MKTAKEWIKWHEENPTVSDEELNGLIQANAIEPFAAMLKKTAKRMANLCAERAQGKPCDECIKIHDEAMALIDSSNKQAEISQTPESTDGLRKGGGGV